MRNSLGSRRKTGKILTTLAISAGVAMFGCSGGVERSQTAKDQFKNNSDTEAKLFKGKIQRTKKGGGIPKSIKGKLADIDKEKTEDQ